MKRLSTLQEQGELDERGERGLAALRDPAHPIWIDLVKKDLALRDIIIPISEGLDLVKSSYRLNRLDAEIHVNFPDPSAVMKNHIDTVSSKYNYIIIDNPPSLSSAVACAYMAMDIVVAPSEADIFSIEALSESLQQLELMNKRFKRRPQLRCVINKYENRRKSHGECLLEINSLYKDYMIPHSIRASADVQAALLDGLTVYELGKKSEVASDIDQVLKSLLGFSESNTLHKKQNARPTTSMVARSETLRQSEVENEA